ncbi:MAG: helix-turn-helix domain-containing protein [Bacteroides sp.]
MFRLKRLYIFISAFHTFVKNFCPIYADFCAFISIRRPLEETDLSVSEISSRTGFHGQGYFGRCFREKKNCTPREYRAGKQY